MTDKWTGDPGDSAGSPGPDLFAVAAARPQEPEKKRRLRALPVTIISTVVAVVLAVVLLIVLSGSVVATAFLGGSGTATVNLTANGSGNFNGMVGGKGLSGKAGSASSFSDPKFTITGSLDGTSFNLVAQIMLSAQPSTQGTSPSIGDITALDYNVTGTFGSDAVRGTFVWHFPPFTSAAEVGPTTMSLHGTVGSHTLNATATVPDSDSSKMSVTFHYTFD
jgi:hypothetical protein